ncbi:RDD family protein [Carboxydothermus pertinax]|uniref:RDD family protein n=1 Tax=Carboxydothermus pertinax TaxID=870242 RepID=A0A1L8CWT5_9THEO|nr:RDD family protein [Carboxydothermus pertinax]GAV23329.1 RDD family protein [Carboxydothermus pertinax]
MQLERGEELSQTNPFPVQAPHGMESEHRQQYAGFWVRFLAAVLDSIALFAAFTLINVLLGVDIFNPPPVIDLLQSIVSIIYYVVMTVILGQTLGKMALGIRVIRQDGGPNSWGAILLRETVGKFLSTLILFIGYLMAAFDPQKRALHDRIAKTFVVKVWK